MEPKPNVVLYHADCADGFTAAWVAWRVLKDTADYYPVKYGDRSPVEGRRGTTLYILDFSYPVDVMGEFCRKWDKVVLLDHHKTALENLGDFEATNLTKVLDQERCGAHLTWLHFNVDDSLNYKLPPLLICYVGDRDLWKFKLTHSREINVAIQSHPFTFDVWTMLHSCLSFDRPRPFDDLINEGTAILRVQEKSIELACSHAREVTLFDDTRVLGANVSDPKIISDVGNRLAAQQAAGVPGETGIGMTWWEQKDRIVISLRSLESGPDVSALAKRAGGGGHKHAAGFTVKSVTTRWIHESL